MSKNSGYRALAAATVAAVLALALPAAAHADSWKHERDRGWDRGERGWDRGEQRHHRHHRHHDRGGWGDHYAPPVVVMPAPRPRVVYAPPPGYYYEQPPAVVYAPPGAVYPAPAPGIVYPAPQRAGVNIGVYLPIR